jgi:hypothetical protein
MVFVFFISVSLGLAEADFMLGKLKNRKGITS